MTSALAREMSITYNSYKVGGDQSNRILNDVHTLSLDNEKGTLEFTFTISHTSAAAFKNECAAAERAYRRPFQDTKVTQGSADLVDWAQSTSFGYNANAQIVKYGDKDDGGYARWYRVKIEVGLPADVNDTAYGRKRFINVSYSPSRRRTATISGTYTANGSTAARAQYEAVFAAYTTTVLNALGGAWKKLEEPQSTADENDKEIQFSVTFEEIIYTGVGSGDASLRGEQLTITRHAETPGDSPDGGSTVERLIRLTAIYEAWFDKTVTMDLVGKWSGLRSAVVTAMQNVLTGGSIGIVGESPQYDLNNNKFTVTLEAVGSTTNGVLEYKENVVNDINFGENLVGVTDGNPWSKFRYKGPGRWQRTITQAFTSMRGGDPGLSTSGALEPPNGFEKVQISLHRDVSPVRWGLPGFNQMLDARRVTDVRVLEFYQQPKTQVASPGGGGGAAPSGGTASGGRAGGGGGGTSSPGQGGDIPGGGEGAGAAAVEPIRGVTPQELSDFIQSNSVRNGSGASPL